MMKTVFSCWLLAAALAIGVPAGAQSSPTPGPAPSTDAVPFVLHARFYSDLSNHTPAIDPQVFVRDDAAEAGTGPQGIDHGKGFRPARLDDAPEVPLYNADGEQLLFTFAKWTAASGSLHITPMDAGDRVSATFANLIAFGVYSLFEIAFNADGTTTTTPLDGDGANDGFIAGPDGTANVAVATPAHLPPGVAIVLVYHSDALDHGASRGDLGLIAHEELIARLPAKAPLAPR